MKQWDERSRLVARRTPDREMARALYRMAALRERDVEAKGDEFCALIVEGYYEIIKELLTALLAIDGFRTTSHECLIGYAERHCPELSRGEIVLMDQLRRMRNDISYRGVSVPGDYLVRNRERIRAVIGKLKDTVSTRLEE